MKKLLKFLPILIIILLLIGFFASGLNQYFSLDWLKQNRETLINYTNQHTLFSALIFCLIYIIAVTVSIPGATILTLLAGFLFGIWLGTFYVVISASIGACILFIAARTAFYDLFHRKAAKWLTKFEKGFEENATSYLLFLRLVPIFPFWLINIIPAFLGVRLRTFAWTTLIGIIPGTAVYVAVGNGLGTVFSEGKALDLGIIFKPEVLIPLACLAIISLVPILYKKWRAKK